MTLPPPNDCRVPEQQKSLQRKCDTNAEQKEDEEQPNWINEFVIVRRNDGQPKVDPEWIKEDAEPNAVSQFCTVTQVAEKKDD